MAIQIPQSTDGRYFTNEQSNSINIVYFYRCSDGNARNYCDFSAQLQNNPEWYYTPFWPGRYFSEGNSFVSTSIQWNLTYFVPLSQENFTPEELIARRQEKQPFLVAYGTEAEPESYALILETTILPCGSSFSRAFEVLFASFFVYDVKFPSLMEPWYNMVGDLVFNIIRHPSPSMLDYGSQLDATEDSRIV